MEVRSREQIKLIQKQDLLKTLCDQLQYLDYLPSIGFCIRVAYFRNILLTLYTVYLERFEKRRDGFIHIIILCLVVISCTKRRKYENSHEILAVKNTSIDIRGTLRQKFYLKSALTGSTENSICSPISALMPLGKLALGAVGDSLQELLTVIGLSKKSKIDRHFQRLIAEMQYLPGVKLRVASKFFIGKDVHLTREYKRECIKTFKSTADRVDFSETYKTVEIMNMWITENTGGKITDMVSPSEISPHTILFIVNAIYFYGNWENPFASYNNRTFQTLHGDEKVRMMRVVSKIPYTVSAALKAEIVKVPYKGGKTYFLIVLPDRKSDLRTLLKTLKRTPDLLDLAMSELSEAWVNLIMPTFKIETEIDLGKIYEQLGVKQIFNHDSGLDEMARGTTVRVSSAKQRAYIGVYENGTEAGAASFISVAKTSFVTLKTVEVNRPFLFFIMAENQQLFSGVVSHPRN